MLLVQQHLLARHAVHAPDRPPPAGGVPGRGRGRLRRPPRRGHHLDGGQADRADAERDVDRRPRRPDRPRARGDPRAGRCFPRPGGRAPDELRRGPRQAGPEGRKPPGGRHPDVGGPKLRRPGAGESPALARGGAGARRRVVVGGPDLPFHGQRRRQQRLGVRGGDHARPAVQRPLPAAPGSRGRTVRSERGVASGLGLLLAGREAGGPVALGGPGQRAQPRLREQRSGLPDPYRLRVDERQPPPPVDHAEPLVPLALVQRRRPAGVQLRRRRPRPAVPRQRLHDHPLLLGGEPVRVPPPGHVG